MKPEKINIISPSFEAFSNEVQDNLMNVWTKDDCESAIVDASQLREKNGDIEIAIYTDSSMRRANFRPKFIAIKKIYFSKPDEATLNTLIARRNLKKAISYRINVEHQKDIKFGEIKKFQQKTWEIIKIINSN